LLVDVRDLLNVANLDAYLFGSRRHRTGSVRSDIDILIFLDPILTGTQAQEIWNLEPYLDIFYGRDGSVRSSVNESSITLPDRESLIRELNALPLFIDGNWQSDADEWRIQNVLADRSPSATKIELYELGTDPPANRADILAVAALAEEYRAAVGILGSVVRGDQTRCEIVDQHGSPWSIELALINSMGSVQAALQTQDSLRRTKASHVVLLGIAAGVPGRVKIGDVVIPEQIYYYESSKVVGEEELTSPQWKQTDARIRRAASVFPGIAGSTLPFIPIITDAVIASGEKVVASQDFRERFSQVHRKVAAIDMESYGVACAAERRGARLTVIKGISDFADATKNDDYHEPAARASAQVFAYPVREGIFGLSFNDD